MARTKNKEVRFISSSIKVPSLAPCSSSPFPVPPILSALPFARLRLDCFVDSVQSALACYVRTLNQKLRPKLALAISDQNRDPKSITLKEERILISEVLVRTKDGEPLERSDLEEEAKRALRASRANTALTSRDVDEDVTRIVETGLFRSCVPVAFDTRDGIRLVFQVEPNQEFRGLICEGANHLPTKFLQDAFHDQYGKIVNIRHLERVIKSINNWYYDRGLLGAFTGIEILSGGMLRMQVSECEVNNIILRFLDRKMGEPTVGKTKPETILQQLTTKKGQVFNREQVQRDTETILTMGIMEMPP